MTYLEILGAIIAGAGTMASILGIFFAVYTRKNGRMTRELVEKMEEKSKDEHRQTRELISQENRLTRDLIERMDKRFDEGLKRLDEGFRYIASLIEKIDERAEKRNLELVRLFQANPPRHL